jgi:hypothetical protein
MEKDKKAISQKIDSIKFFLNSINACHFLQKKKKKKKKIGPGQKEYFFQRKMCSEARLHKAENYCMILGFKEQNKIYCIFKH